MGEVISMEEWKKGNRPVSKPQPPQVAPVAVVTADSTLPRLELLATRLHDGREGFSADEIGRRMMRYTLRDMLAFVNENGKPNAVAIFIGVNTQHEGFVAPDWLKQQYPDEIILQIDGWWQDLVITNEAFHVQLNFLGSATPLVVPFDAVVSVYEDSTKFGISFANASRRHVPTDPQIA